ncbi:MAG: type II secretion system protein [Deltaproteobacteria bacterium]|nr:type II secretion system protein [Deltaproteobacteria bacterium]
MFYSKARGFTLLELLIAISMLVIVLTTLYGSYRSILTRNPWIENEIQTQEMARTCLNQMLADLGSAYVVPFSEYKPPQSSDAPNPYRMLAENHSTGKKTFPWLSFSSLFHLRLGDRRQQDIAHIAYYVHPLPNGAFVLRRSETLYPYPPFKENPADPVLCKDIRSLSYTFYDSKGKDYQVWDSDSSDYGRETPAAIHITMELEARQGTTLKMETGLVFPAFRAGNTRKR